MNIYPVLPYVYQCVHKTTGKIYIGSRTAKSQKLPSNLDFPKYKTSSKIVKPIFDEFRWFIVAEFFNPKDAYDFEQELIHEQWQVSKEMSLNKACHHGKVKFNTIGSTFNHSKETKFKLRKPKPPRSEEHKKNLSKPRSKESRDKMSESKLGISLSDDHIRKLSESHIGVKRKPFSKKHIENLSRSHSIIYDFLTPDGFVIENTTMKELCSQFNLKYVNVKRNFGNNKHYKGFIRL